MDNARIHHGWTEQYPRQLFQTKNIELLYLPPYSPDLALLENFIGVVKFFRKDCHKLYEENSAQTIARASEKLTPDHFLSFYQQCGYCENDEQ
jgi:transposase